jgi:hypothetical protein
MTGLSESISEGVCRWKTRVHDALRNPRREIRLAGLLALIERPDHAATAQLLTMSLNEKDPYVRAETNRAMWAMKVVQMAEVQLASRIVVDERLDVLLQ